MPRDMQTKSVGISIVVKKKYHFTNSRGNSAVIAKRQRSLHRQADVVILAFHAYEASSANRPTLKGSSRESRAVAAIDTWLVVARTR